MRFAFGSYMAHQDAPLRDTCRAAHVVSRFQLGGIPSAEIVGTQAPPVLGGDVSCPVEVSWPSASFVRIGSCLERTGGNPGVAVAVPLRHSSSALVGPLRSPARRRSSGRGWSRPNPTSPEPQGQAPVLFEMVCEPEIVHPATRANTLASQRASLEEMSR
jgi:hypothetical protein